MNVLIYKDNLSTWRGADHLICSIASSLAERGHEITIATSPGAFGSAFQVSDNVHKVEVAEVDVRALLAGFDCCLAAGPNEICTLTERGTRRSPIPTIVSLLVSPNGFFKWRHPIRNWRIRRAFRLADILQVQCHAYVSMLNRIAPGVRIEPIAQWPDLSGVPFELAAGDREKAIVYPPAMNRHKNQLLVIRAFALIADEFPEWQLHLYGKKNRRYGEKCLKVVRGLKAASRIRFFDFISSLSEVYSKASILAFPSLMEGFPLTIVEAMSRSLPAVLLEDLPAAHELVRHAETGWVAPATVEGYANALRELMRDEELRVRLGQSARRDCESRFVKDRIIDRWEVLLQELSSQKVG